MARRSAIWNALGISWVTIKMVIWKARFRNRISSSSSAATIGSSPAEEIRSQTGMTLKERPQSASVVDYPSGHRASVKAACTRRPPAGTMPKLRPRRSSENKPATSVITSLRDDQETERCNGYQRNLLNLSTRPKNRTTVGLSIHMSAPSCHDGPAWPCTGALCPCICRQPPGNHQRLSK